MKRWMSLPLILTIGLVGCGGDDSPTGPSGKDEIVTVATFVGRTLQINKRLLESTKITFEGNDGTYIMNPNGSNQIMLFDEYFDKLYWSPDGRKILIIKEGNQLIYVMNADGSDRKELGLYLRLSFSTSPWSPDGSMILFSGTVADTFYIHLINADGSGRQQLVKGRGPSWSSDGKKFVFTRWVEGENQEIKHHVYTANADGSNEKQLSEGFGTSWSPDGDHIAFYNCDSGDCDDLYDIYVIDPDGNNKKKIGSGDWEDYSLAWSPDGKRIAFIGEYDYYLFIVGSEGDSESLSITSGNYISHLSWSPDGSKIVFQTGDEDEEGKKIEMINPSGSNRVTVVKDVGKPVWSPFIPRGVFVE